MEIDVANLFERVRRPLDGQAHRAHDLLAVGMHLHADTIRRHDTDPVIATRAAEPDILL